MGASRSKRPGRFDSLASWAIGLIPVTTVAVGFALGRLSPNPIEDVTHVTGEWTLRFLVLTLAVTPLRRITGISRLMAQRRTLGLLAFTYGVLHALTWAVLDQGLHWPSISEDLVERPFVWMGALGLVAMTPLAVTSTRTWMRRLGPRWKQLHRLVWVALAAGVTHFWWGVKADELEPLVYALVAVALVAARFRLSRSRA